MRWDIMMMTMMTTMMTIDFHHVTGLRCCGFFCFVLLIVSFLSQTTLFSGIYVAALCNTCVFDSSDRSHLILIKHRSGLVRQPLHN